MDVRRATGTRYWSTTFSVVSEKLDTGSDDGNGDLPQLPSFDCSHGRNIGDLFFSAGIPNFLGGLHAVDSECSREGAGGRFFILNLDYTDFEIRITQIKSVTGDRIKDFS